jgi:phosphoglycolate phosphatase
MCKPKIFIDLDGTILDVSERIYQIYKKILKRYGKKILSKKEYIKLKKEKTSNLEILSKTNAEEVLIEFEKEWLENIEKKEFLKLDELSEENRKFLLNTKKDFSFILVTLRRNTDNLLYELKSKKISEIFDKVLVDDNGDTKENWKIKYDLIKSYGGYNNAIIVGDTKTEIMAGKKLGLKTVAITSGMTSKDVLEKYKPDYLIKNISEIRKWNF